MTDTLPQTVKELLHRAGESVPPERLSMIEEAYHFAFASHDGQMRKSGEPYIIHPVDAALTVAELEDRCFMYLEPEQSREISESLRVSRDNRESYVTQVVKLLNHELESQGIKSELSGRAKHVYSIHLKMKRYAEMGKSFNDI